MKVDLTGKVAVVTGGGGILCGEMSRALAAAGAKVAILDLKKEAADRVQKILSGNIWTRWQLTMPYSLPN